MGHLGIAWMRRLENLTTELSYSSARLDSPRRRRTFSSPITSNEKKCCFNEEVGGARCLEYNRRNCVWSCNRQSTLTIS